MHEQPYRFARTNLELYYQQNLSQQDISKITGISRPTISRLLDEEETGVVEIIVHSPINKIRSFPHLVRTTFGLRDAVIVTGDYEFDQSLTRCAHCAVDFLSTVLENNMSIGISLGPCTGSTVRCPRTDRLFRLL